MIFKFFSNILFEEREYQIILPQGYETSNQAYPVLYMLHGKNQNHMSWTQYTYLELISDEYPFILVMPEGDDKWFMDFKHGYERFQLYIKELICHIDREFRTLADKKNRGICGISMGGYAAFLIAMNHKELFNSVSALSGVLNIKNHISDDVFQNELPVDKKDLEELNLLEIAKKIDSVDFHILFDSGTDDKIAYKDSIEFSGILSNLGILYTFNQYTGGHDWYYWDEHLKEHLDFHKNHIIGDGA